MKSNLAVLSSDNKTIQFIKNNNLEDLCNLYANSSRNTDDAKLFSENYGFEKYYGSYEDLIEDSNIEYIVNFLPTGIKFEYTYLALKKNKKIISNYPIISNKNELEGYQELKNLELIPNLFLVDDQNFKNFYNESKDKKFVSYLLTFKQDLEILLTQRSVNLKNHPGQISFPGGKKEKFDRSPVETALRETEEEVGLNRQLVEIIASLPTHKTATGFIIRPYIGIVSQSFQETLQCDEVDEIFTVPLDHILNEKNFSVQTRKWNGSQRRYYIVPYGPHYIWGATARILLNLSRALTQ